MLASRSSRASLSIAALVALATLAAPTSSRRVCASTPPTSIDLSTYVRVGRFDLPEPTRTAHPVNSLLAQEASAVTYDGDTDTLFVVGDGGTSVVQVTKTGALVDSMTLAPGGSPQGTEFYDTEGITYVGGGKFVLVEERDRQVSLFTYVAGATLTRAAVQTVTLGTFVGNVGIEGVSYDPATAGFIAVKEVSPEGIFQTNVDFPAGTATNGSPTTVNSVNLFDPALAGLGDFADVFALSNLPSLDGQPDGSHVLVLSQESGKVVEMDRSGAIYSTLVIQSDLGNPLSVAGQQHEGLTMDRDGRLYLANENGGGDFDHPQLWVYAPASGVNHAPTGLVVDNAVASIAENTSSAAHIKVADLTVLDDGLGVNTLSLSGADAASFEIAGTSLFLRAGTVLDYETKTSYSLFVDVDDASVGATPDASAPYNLAVADVVDETATGARLVITEVSAWGSGNSPYAADWFEVTNTGATAQSIAGWKMDDNSNSFGSAVTLHDVASIAPGQSAVFLETTSTASATVAATLDSFKTTWFGGHVPVGLAIGWYSGGGVGLSTGGDAVNLFDAAGARVTGVAFGASPAGPFKTFDNTSGAGSTTLPLPTVATLSSVGTNGAFAARNDAAEIGSPGRIAEHAPVANAGVDRVVEATGPSGAAVALSGAGSFDADGDLLGYAWAEGATPVGSGPGPVVVFSIGAHTATLTVSDDFGGSASDSVLVTVVDSTAPAIGGTPDGITVEATSAAGAVVTFTPPTALDLVDGAVVVECVYPSGSTFPVGVTFDTCTATDAHGNHSSSSFRVTVRDTTPPTVTVPADVTLDATSPAGAVVSFVASATDAVGVATFSCVPPSGSTFAVGTTTVVCTATDAAGNSASESFHVLVRGAADLLTSLLAEVTGVGPGKSLRSKVLDAVDALAAGDARGTCAMLDAFVHEVEAQSGKKISADLASALVARARAVQAAMGC